MRITLINPNITESMSRDIENAAKSVAAEGTEITVITSPSGPDAIESLYDEAIAASGVMETVLKIEKEKSADAIIIACFGDPALQVAKQLSSVPVIGIAQAAMYMAALIAPNFSIVTDLQLGVYQLKEIVHNYGMDGICASVRATNIPVLSFEAEHDAGLDALEEQSKIAIKEDHAEAILLACAGLVTFTEELQAKLGCPVLDGVTSAVKLAEGLVSMGKTTSKVCTFSKPQKKVSNGYAATIMNYL